jgi:RNA polymerase sigma factor (TIGR02999 family)
MSDPARFPATGPATQSASEPATSSTTTSDSLERLVPLLYDELRAIAHRQLMGGRIPGQPDRTLATTALVNEAYLKLAGGRPGPWVDRPHFLATAALAMRQILVDRARARATAKRGGGRANVTLDEEAIAMLDEPEVLLEIDEALVRLAVIAPRLSRVVECRFYGGMSEEEIAAALGVTVRTVQRDWVKARMLLRRELHT